ncbi:MAG: peptidyl-prolyl cis-trans isomerase D, partial [Kiritimatiellia bacterium]
MSIMEKMRGSTDSTPMQVVLVLIVIAFVGWFAVPQGDKVYVVVEVNGERVLQQDFGRRYGTEKQIREIQSGGTMDAEAEKSFAQEVKQNIARELVLQQAAEKMGLVVSDAEMAGMIKHDVRFAGEDGKFKRSLYDDEVTRRSRSAVEAQFRNSVIRNKLQTIIAASVTVNEAETKKNYVEEYGTLDLDFIRVEPMMVRMAFPVDQAERGQWIRDNTERIEAQYEADKAVKYDIPEQLQLAVIRLRVAEADSEDELKLRLTAVRNEASAGADFGALARKWSEDATAEMGGDMGLRRVNTITTDIRDAVADVDIGGVSAVIVEVGALAVYRVQTRIDARVIELEEVQGEIAERMMLADRSKSYADDLYNHWSQSTLPPFSTLMLTGATVAPMTEVSPSRYFGGIGQPPKGAVEAIAAVEVSGVGEPFAFDGPGGMEYFII